MRRRGRAATLLAALAMLATAAPASSSAAQDQPGAYIDVTEGVHKPAIDALAAKGLFEGTLCGDGEFCPNEPIKRSTMAVWLVRAIDGAEPPQPQDPRFVDVAASTWAGHIERLAQLSITTGCATDPLRYCPQDTVTRAQMASFLTRAFNFEAAEPAGFVDLEPDSSHNAIIDDLAAAGITAGCATDPLRYCPQDSVTRAQMATFLARALNHNQKLPPPASANPQTPPPRASSPPPPPPPQEPVDPPPDNEDPPDPDRNAGSPESNPPPSQEPLDPPPDNEDPPDTDDQPGDCDPDDLCFIPLTEEEWRKARERIFGE